ncbi:MAG: histidine--tRNA ligase [Acidobacteriota bacterium]
MASTNPARGMRDFLPADVRKREYVIGIIKEVYESYGFEPLETPAVENLETLTGKYGEEGNQLIFRILKRGEKLGEALKTARSNVISDDKGRSGITSEMWDFEKFTDLALRYDLTVPLARVVANNKNDLPKFFKRYQIQPVWRADRPGRGRYREFYQCDVDAIGSSSMVVEAELIAAVSEILRRLGFEDFIIRINHREILRDILDTASIPIEMQTDALIAIDKLDKIGTDGVARELADRGIDETAAGMILDIFEQTRLITESGKDVNRTIVGNLLNIVSAEVLGDVGKILQYTAGHPVFIDPSLARGLSYYTGTIMEITVHDLAGSLAGGGRYDGLIGMFGKEQIPACGFSLGLERILVVMDERGMFPPEIAGSTPADVMVALWSDETAGESLKLAAELRAAGLRVTVYPEADKLGKQLKYADAIKIPFACILGESEIAEGKAMIKDMRSGEQVSEKRNEAATRLKQMKNG